MKIHKYISGRTYAERAAGFNRGGRFATWYDPESLEDTNRVREMDGKKPLTSLNGYCMSTGCSCRKEWGDGSKGWPICGLFRSYDTDGIKKDFIYQLLGI